MEVGDASMTWPYSLDDEELSFTLAPSVTFADELYAALAPLQYDEENQHNALLNFCKALSSTWELLYTVARDPNHGGPWGVVFDVDTCPDEFLQWLAQFAGVRLDKGLSEADTRAAIDATSGTQRGTPIYLAGLLQQQGYTNFLIQERHLNDAWQIRFLVLASEDDSSKHAAVETGLPAGILPNWSFWNGRIYASTTSQYASYSATSAARTTYTARSTAP